jgi:hypothetical protein
MKKLELYSEENIEQMYLLYSKLKNYLKVHVGGCVERPVWNPQTIDKKTGKAIEPAPYRPLTFEGFLRYYDAIHSMYKEQPARCGFAKKTISELYEHTWGIGDTIKGGNND